MGPEERVQVQLPITTVERRSFEADSEMFEYP